MNLVERLQEIAGRYGLPEAKQAADLIEAQAKRIEELEKDAARLDVVARHGISFRNDPKTEKWYMTSPYNTNVFVVDDHTRFDSYREAIDAAMQETQK